MKKTRWFSIYLIVLFLVCLLIFESGCEKGDEDNNDNSQNTSSVTDADGNVYDFVTIGTQIWMTKNLGTTKFKNGTPIANVADGTEWHNTHTPAYCWYDNNQSSYGNVYGALYNAYAVHTGNLCPTGWHVPSAAEWTTLIDFLGGASVGGKLKENGTTHWMSPNIGATNESGFKALPGGFRWNNSTGSTINYAGYWWSSTVGIYPSFTRTFFMYHDYSFVYNGDYDNGYGLSVRCIKD